MSAPGVRATLRALVAPRRLIPMLLVAASLILAQAAYDGDRLGVPLAALFCVVFFSVAPVSWRLLFFEAMPLPRAAVLTAIYGAIGVGVVSALGLVLPRWLEMGPTLLTRPSNLVVCVALFLVGGWGLGRDLSFEDRLRTEAARADLMTRRAEDAQLLALRTHLDPHFLFNTLNAIAEWCVEDGAVAERAVLQLSAMLRTILSGVRASTWSLGEELQLLHTLCELHRLRDPAAFSVQRETDEALNDVRVPPMLLVPLVENAIKHGPSAGHRGEIYLRVRRVDDRLHIAVQNPGPYLGPRAGSDGLPTLERRLSLAYLDLAHFHIAASGACTLAELDLPLQLSSPEAA